MAIEINPAILRAAFNPTGFKIDILRGRSVADWQDSLAYARWFLVHGRVGSRADREYLDKERAARRFTKMSSALKTYEFEEDDDEGELFSKNYSLNKESPNIESPSVGSPTMESLNDEGALMGREVGESWELTPPCKSLERSSFQESVRPK